MRKSVIEYVSDYARNTPDKVAVISKGAETTYGELFRLVCGYGKYLQDSDVKKGDIVVVRASQTLDYAVIYLGVHLAGGVISSLERSTSDEGMLSVARQLNARVLITDKTELAGEYPAVYLNRKGVLESALSQDIADYEYSFPDLEDSADILFTTGTTGASKGVELSHKALVATAENLIYGCGYKADTVLVVPGPLNHANAIRKFFTSMVNGSTICILNGMMNLKNFFDALDYPNGTVACCLPPSAIRTVFQLTQDKLGQYADKIDFIESATAPLPEPDKQKLCELLPNTRLYNNYGSSESASVCMYDYNKYPGMAGCVGKAMPNSRIVIVDDGRDIIESSKERMGLLACIGDVNMKGYVNEPELTREVLIDGVVYTNDIGYIDENGFIFVSGRKGDVINVGGFKVAPTEVESAALEFEGVEDCICIPVDDNLSGKAVKLLVVFKQEEEFSVKDMKKYLASRLEGYKVPTHYELVDHVERTYNGKLNRKFYL